MDALTAYRLLVADVYELAGRSRETSDQLAATQGQTAARWHVLSAITDGPRTVPSIARRLGLRRQSVQRVVNDLAAESLVALEDNPEHARSRLVALTEKGKHLVDELFVASAASRNDLLDSAGISASDLVFAHHVLRALIDAYPE